MSPARSVDERWMRLALELARMGEGMTRPNPPVGAVLVKNRKIVGRGFHKKAGRPHAEIEAISEAGGKARNATLYVTMEPCSTMGQTGPCTEAVLSAGIGRVAFAVRDPNPAHCGAAAKILRRRGVGVSVGILGQEASDLIEPFGKRVATGLPFITLKLAMTLDGKIADPGGASRWITGKESRADVQALRRTADAILVGANTVRADDPSLLPRPAGGRKPFRVVVAGTGAIQARRKVFCDMAAERTLFAVPRAAVSRAQRMLKGSAARVLPCRAGRGGVNLKDLVKKLADLGALHVFCEGGGCISGSLIRANLVDRYVLYYGPGFLGENGTTAGIQGVGWGMKTKPELSIESAETLGEDVKITAIPARLGHS